MKGFFFLLLTISLLVMIQIQSGMLQNDTTPHAGPRSASQTIAATATAAKVATSKAPSMAIATTRKPKDAAPALNSLGSGCVLIFLTNVLIQLFYLS